MDAARWERIQVLFHEALRVAVDERHTFLARECGGDSELQADVLAMLEEDCHGASLLDDGLARFAHDVLGKRPPIPRAIGPYTILRVLGEGGMGVVYLGERENLGGFAAIKVLRDASLSPARSERFVSEQRALVQLNHPSIVRLYDANILADQTPYFVMEHVEGTSITDYCNAHRLSIAERLRLFCDVCNAVQHAHGRAIIHRDLKPSNILVTEEGVVKLLDFGISKQLESVDLPASQTQTMLRIMTPAYAAPEQLLSRPVGVYTDVYALGVLLYELLAGNRPFDTEGMSHAQVEKLVLESEPARPSAVVRNKAMHVDGVLPASGITNSGWADLDMLCATAMHKDPERRYPTAHSLRQDVYRYLRNEPLKARPDTVGYSLGKFLSRNRRAVAATAAAFGVAVGLVAFYSARLADARDAALAEASRASRIQAFMLDLFQGGDEATGPADSLRVLTLLDKVALEAGAFGTEPEIQAEIYATLGALYQGLGNLDRADTLLTSALHTRRATLGADHQDVAKSLVALGQLRVDQGRFEEAEQLVREGLLVAERRLDARHATLIHARSALGHVHQARGEYAKAIDVLKDVVARLAPESAEYRSALSELASTHYYMGDYAVFDSLNESLLTTNSRVYGERHPSVGDNLMNRGAAAFQRGRYDQAEAAYRRAFEIFDSFHGSEHHQTASSMTAVGRSLVYQERAEEAEPILRRALAIRERIFGTEHPDVATTRNELGAAALSLGNLADAEREYLRVTDIYRTAYGDDHYYIGIALSNLASVYLRAGAFERADPVFREVIEIFERELSSEHFNTAIARIKLGRVLVSQQRYREAETELRTGYDLLLEQTDPSVSWIRNAREDLIAVYDALGESERAAELLADAISAAETGSSP